jgi:hypothetical protein
LLLLATETCIYSSSDNFTQTVSYDDMGPVEEDPRWKIQGEFGDFLEKEYERV